MSRIDILWSPYPDKFIIFGNDLRLYQVEHSDGQKISGAIQLSETTFAHVLATNTDVQFVKCISCYPKGIDGTDVLLAAGQTSGKIALTSFQYNSEGPVCREFSPKHARQCNCLDWNPVENSLLAVGYDKMRTDNAVVIWDVQKPEFQNSTPDQSASLTNKPLQEFALGEVALSLKWFSTQNRVLVCGMNNKQLKIYDLRDSGKPKIIPTKAVYGLTLDPFYEYRFASFYENHQYVWDSRNIKKPLTSLEPEPKLISKLEWCTTRANLLASLSKESFGIKIYDIQEAPIVTTDLEPTVIERIVNPYNIQNKVQNNVLSSFIWHPEHESRMFVVTVTGNIRDFTVVDRITLNWSPASEIIWTHGKKLLQCIDSRDQFYESLDDIAVKMRNRAVEGYGIRDNKTYQLFPEDSPWYNLWQWVEYGKQTDKGIEGFLKSLSIDNKDDSNSVLNGVRSILIQQSSGDHFAINSRSEKVFLNTIDLASSYVSSSKSPVIYKSVDRRRALQLCGWDSNFEMPNANVILIDKLESSKKWSRAAAISVFYYRIRRAIQSLRKGADLSVDHGGDPNLGPIAMALSGYSKEKISLWRETCSNLRVQMTDSYLKAIFTFLTTYDNDLYSEILFDRDLALSDRVAFACIYLSDSTLCDYLSNLTRQMIETGDLNGILLTGVTKEGIDLFEHYIEQTSDVQTVSLILLKCLPNPIYQHPKAKMWVESYRQLLDCWRLWNLRALFDNEWYRNLSYQETPKQHLYVSCNYCSSSVSSYIIRSQMKSPESQPAPTRRNPSVTAASHKTRIQSCPTCRKPLPRCALCLTQLGTPAGTYWRHGITFSEKDNKLSPFNTWFTWCQTCRHGGHSIHIIDWFDQHNECPVSGCTCKCMSLDSTAKLGMSTN